MLHNSLSPAEIYTIAADTAYPEVQRHWLIRENALFADGELAETLATAGAVILGRRPEAEDDASISEHHDLLTDYVVSGASLSFLMLQNVIDPSLREWGPNAYQVTACNAEGEVLTPARSHSSEKFLNMIRRRHQVTMGDSRSDCYQAAATGIGIEVCAKTAKAGQAAKFAQRLSRAPELESYAMLAIDLAARLSIDAALATATSNTRPGELISSLHVRIGPVNKESTVENSSRVVTLYDDTAEHLS